MTKGSYFAGIDLGSGYIKIVLMENEALRASRVMPTSGIVSTLVTRGMDAILGEAGITFESLEGVATTGYGKYKLPFDHKKVSPLSAGAAGAHFFFPDVRTIIDIGVQQSSVVRIDGSGNIDESIVSEKCAAGSGWFLKVVARVMGISMEELSEFSLKSRNPVTITTDCAVFAETEVISRIAEGNPREDIVAGAHKALAQKINDIIQRIGIAPECALIGGTGKDAGFVKYLNGALGMKICVPEKPRLAMAIGAVLFHLGK